MKRQHSLRTELLLLCVGIVVLVTVVQIVGNLLFFQKVAVWEKENQIEALYTILVENYSDDPVELYTLLEPYQEEQNISVHIESSEGAIYTSNSVSLGDREVEVFSQRDQLIFDHVAASRDDFLNYGAAQPEGPTDIPGGAMVGDAMAPMVETDQIVVQLTYSFYYEGEVRTVALWSSVAALEESVSLFTRINVAVSLVVLVLGIVFIIFLSRRLTKPIEVVDGVAKKMARGDFSDRAQEEIPTRELSSLSSSINTMADSLQQMIATLEEDKQSLVDEVEDQQKIEQMRRQFIANISHEMKTPLSMLMMYSESLKLDIPNIDKNFYYDTIIEEAKGLNDMVAQMLDISSLENGLSQLQLGPINLSELLEELVGKYAPILAPFQFTAAVEPRVWVMGERNHLSQAITNYLNNAVAHTKDGDEIKLRLKAEGGQVVVSLFNQGVPIDHSDLAHLWDSFYRADKARTGTSEKRVGLGLYIVKTAIQAHSGQVGVENHPDGVTFSFTLDTTQESM